MQEFLNTMVSGDVPLNAVVSGDVPGRFGHPRCVEGAVQRSVYGRPLLAVTPGGLLLASPEDDGGRCWAARAAVEYASPVNMLMSQTDSSLHKSL